MRSPVPAGSSDVGVAGVPEVELDASLLAKEPGSAFLWQGVNIYGEPFLGPVREARAPGRGTRRLTSPWASLALVFALAPLQACGGGSAPGNVAVYVSLGSRQCEGGGRSLADVQRSAQAAGLTIVSASCGTDGAMHAAVCGGPDGRIAILDIPGAQLATARSQGLKPLTELPDARRTPCG